MKLFIPSISQNSKNRIDKAFLKGYLYVQFEKERRKNRIVVCFCTGNRSRAYLSTYHQGTSIYSAALDIPFSFLYRYSIHCSFLYTMLDGKRLDQRKCQMINNPDRCIHLL